MTDTSENSAADDMSEYLQAYLDESDEELETLVQSLLTLEDNPRETAAMNEAFRMLHSLKGSSGMMGFEGIAELAHHLETRFDQLRAGSAAVDRATMDVMLQCVDFFRVFVTQLRAGKPVDQDGSALIARLESSAENSVDGAVPTVDSATSRPGGPGLLTLGGGCRVRVTFRKGLQLADLKARLIVARLSNIGDIVGSDPPIDSIVSSADLPQFVVVVATDKTPAEVLSIANVDGVESVRIDSASDGDPKPSVRDETPDFRPDSELFAEPRATVLQPHERATETRTSSGEADDGSGTSSPAETGVGVVSGRAQVLEAAGKPSPSDVPELTRQRVAETVRVDIDRLDRLMNLTGELVVTNARFRLIAGQISPALRNSRGTGRLSELTERIREGLRRVRATGVEPGKPAGLHGILNELENDLESLQECSELWDEGRQHFSQISEAVDQLTRVSKNLQKGVLDTRMVPVGPLFSRFRRVIRDLSGERHKNVELCIQGEKTELDKRMIDELGDPLLHLIRNSIDHGLESADARRVSGKPGTGVITLEASHSGNNVFITVSDDGAGIDIERVRARIVERGLAERNLAHAMSDQQVMEHIWHPGFSTAEHVTDISGRGVGMDIVKSRISELNGSIEVSTTAGAGTTFVLRLPLTLAIIRSLVIRFRRGFFTIPIDDVREIVSVKADQIHTVHGYRTIDVRGKFVPLTAMHTVFQWRHPDCDCASTPRQDSIHTDSSDVNVVILHSRGKTLGLCVDELLGGADIVVKSLADNFVSICGLSGASTMGDGTVCLMLDTNAVIEMASGALSIH